MLVYQDPNNAAHMVRVTRPDNALIPAGWILQGGSDGAADRDQQAFVPGTAGGGYPTYPSIAGAQTPNPDLTTLATNQRNLNGTIGANAV